MHLKVEPGYTDVEPKSYDLDQFELLYNSMNSSLQKYAEYYVKDIEAAKSIVNDLFIQLWFKNGLPEQIKGYMYRAVKNASLNYLRQNKRNPLSYIEHDELTQISDLHAVYPDISFESDKLKFLQKTIAELPEKRQLVFRMYRLDGFSYAEIADLLQISVRTVEDHLSKSMQFIHTRSKHFIHTNLTEA
jgi:RNA polymerase sigma-70 factor (family 1)